jgi:hypothetical protein
MSASVFAFLPLFLPNHRLLLVLLVLPVATLCLLAVLWVLKPGDDLQVKGFGIRVKVRRDRGL